jgi:hypothetical protein
MLSDAATPRHMPKLAEEIEGGQRGALVHVVWLSTRLGES